MKATNHHCHHRAVILSEFLVYLFMFSTFCGIAVSIYHSHMKVQRHIARHDERRAVMDMVLRAMRRDFLTASQVELTTASDSGKQPQAALLSKLLPPPEMHPVGVDRIQRAIASLSLTTSEGKILYIVWEDAPRDPHPANSTQPAPPPTHTLVRIDAHGESCPYFLAGQLFSFATSNDSEQAMHTIQIRFESPLQIGDGSVVQRRFETTLCAGELP